MCVHFGIPEEMICGETTSPCPRLFFFYLDRAVDRLYAAHRTPTVSFDLFSIVNGRGPDYRKALEKLLGLHPLPWWHSIRSLFPNAEDFYNRIMETMEELPARQREAFLLRYNTERDRPLTYVEVGKRMGHRSRGEAARKLVRKALDTLLDDYDWRSALRDDDVQEAAVICLEYHNRIRRRDLIEGETWEQWEERMNLENQLYREAAAEREALENEVMSVAGLTGKAESMVKDVVRQKWGSIAKVAPGERVRYVAAICRRKARRRFDKIKDAWKKD